MNTWKVILATLVIFTAGVVTGGLLVRHAVRGPQKHPRALWRDAVKRPEAGPVLPGPREPASPGRMLGALPQGLRLDFLQKLHREIPLSPEQRARIERIITEGQERNQQLWNRILPDLRREMQTTRERIRAELNPEQVQRFEELMKQRPQRKGDEPTAPPDRRLRDQPRRSLPPRERPAPEDPPVNRPPAEP